MFERFTEHARRTIFFARNEALVAGAPNIEPAHLILGIMREVPQLFRQLMSGEDRFNALVESLRQRRPLATNAWPLADVPLSEETKDALHRAAELAREGWVTPETLLLATLEQGTARAALESFAITAEAVRSYLKAHPAEPYFEKRGMFGRFTNSGRKVIFFARNAAINARHEAIEPADLVAGIIQESTLLIRALTGQRFEELIEALQSRPDAPPPSQPMNLPLSPDSERAMARAEALAKNSLITPELLLLGILDHDGPLREKLDAFGITAQRVSEHLKTNPPSHHERAGIGLGGCGGGFGGASSGASVSGARSTGSPVPLFRLCAMLPPERREAAERILLSLCDYRVQISGADSQGSFEFKFGQPEGS